jgi:hypothetical protein
MNIKYQAPRGKRRNFQQLNVNVEIHQSVRNRIINTITHSDIEEGGKLLGQISQDKNHMTIKVLSYIDSGPGVDNSATHLHPDGDYQESMFRVLETLDPAIEHIGSWHSHHCNGLPELSGGDIRGYQRSVNNRQYNLDYFFVILIYGFSRKGLRAKYYLFRRGFHDYLQIQNIAVETIPGVYPYEDLLSIGEKMSGQARMPTGFKDTADRTKKDCSRSSPANAPFDSLKEILAADSKWLKENFPSAIATRSKTRQIRWRWQIDWEEDFLFVHYTYPSALKEDEVGVATLEIYFDKAKIIDEAIALNINRHQLIEHYIGAAKPKAVSRIKEAPNIKEIT